MLVLATPLRYKRAKVGVFGMKDIQELWERKRRLDSIRKWTIVIVSGVFASVLLAVGLPWWVLLLIMMPTFIAVLNVIGFLMLPHYHKLKGIR